MRLRSGLSQLGQLEGDHGAAPVSVRRPSRTAVLLGDALDDGQAEARAGLSACLVRAPEAVEDLVDVLLRKAGAVVADRHAPVGDLDLDGPVRGTPLRGVVEQVRDRAPDPL